jgi:hypothetical protein
MLARTVADACIRGKGYLERVRLAAFPITKTLQGRDGAVLGWGGAWSRLVFIYGFIWFLYLIGVLLFCVYYFVALFMFGPIVHFVPGPGFQSRCGLVWAET